jgi:hypothetical protein
LFLSIVGAVSQKSVFIERAKDILLLWARSLPLAGTALVATRKKKGGISLAGLMISRFMDRIVESFWIISSAMSASEREEILAWFAALGQAVVVSHKFWLEHHEIEGPSNHHAWHTFGMVLCGVVTRDQKLISYALHDPRNTWNFDNLLRWAIHNNELTTNMFREGRNSKGELFSFGGVAEDGEFFDRFRSRCEDKPPCGLHYSLFSMRAMVYTAHLVIVNNLSSPDKTNPYDLSCHALKKALHYYGNFFIQFPACTPSCITAEPYREQQLDEHALAAYLVAYLDQPHDEEVVKVLMTNLILPPPIVEPLKGKKGEQCQYPVMQRPLPINTPLCYLVLIYASEILVLDSTKPHGG